MSFKAECHLLRPAGACLKISCSVWHTETDHEGCGIYTGFVAIANFQVLSAGGQGCEGRFPRAGDSIQGKDKVSFLGHIDDGE